MNNDVSCSYCFGNKSGSDAGSRACPVCGGSIAGDRIAEPPRALKEAAILMTACRAADSHWDIAFDLATHAEAAVIALKFGASSTTAILVLGKAVDDYKARRAALIAKVKEDIAKIGDAP